MPFWPRLPLALMLYDEGFRGPALFYRRMIATADAINATAFTTMAASETAQATAISCGENGSTQAAAIIAATEKATQRPQTKNVFFIGVALSTQVPSWWPSSWRRSLAPRFQYALRLLQACLFELARVASWRWRNGLRTPRILPEPFARGLE